MVIKNNYNRLLLQILLLRRLQILLPWPTLERAQVQVEEATLWPECKTTEHQLPCGLEPKCHAGCLSCRQR